MCVVSRANNKQASRINMISNIFLILAICLSLKCILCSPLGGFSLPGSSQPVHDMSVREYGPGYATYGHRQMEVARSRGIKPVVDTIRAEEKYGNDGGKIRTASNAFIRLTEGSSGAISRTLGTPNKNTYNVLAPLDPFFANLGNKLGAVESTETI
ncbi:hypothetical protein CBL_10832 [Carabus blaptoides fortunei]